MKDVFIMLLQENHRKPYDSRDKKRQKELMLIAESKANPPPALAPMSCKERKDRLIALNKIKPHTRRRIRTNSICHAESIAIYALLSGRVH